MFILSGRIVINICKLGAVIWFVLGVLNIQRCALMRLVAIELTGFLRLKASCITGSRNSAARPQLPIGADGFARSHA